MPFCEAVALFDYWNEFPPLHLLAKSYLGYKPKKREQVPADFGKFLQMAKQRGKHLDQAPLRVQQMAEIVARKKVKRG